VRARFWWIPAVAGIVLAARALAYGFVPGQDATRFAAQAGGPALPALAAAALVAALAVAASIILLTTLAVRERLRLEDRLLVATPSFSARAAVVRAVALFAAALPCAALLESYVHWRAGLGWHGLSCLVGPVHRDLVPFLGALSIVVAATSAAVEHLVAWMRRVVATLAPAVRVASRRAALPAPRTDAPRSRLPSRKAAARAPPFAVA
jgi:Na+/proline symporter